MASGEFVAPSLRKVEYISLEDVFINLNLFSLKRFLELYNIYLKNYNSLISKYDYIQILTNILNTETNLHLKSKKELQGLKELIDKIYAEIPENYVFENKILYRPDHPFGDDITHTNIVDFFNKHFSFSETISRDKIVSQNKIFFFMTIQSYAFYVRNISLAEGEKYFILEGNSVKINKDYLNQEIFTEFISIVQEFGLKRASKWLDEGYSYLNMDNEILRMDKLYEFLNAANKFLLFRANPMMEQAKRHYNNEIEIDRTKIEVQSTGKRCRHCGSDNTLHLPMQTRSLDEGYTLITTCLDCGKKEKY